MLKIKTYQIDAFTENVFAGNPAVVCPLDKWLPDHVLQAIAAENNIAVTAFIVPVGNRFHIRWFTPVIEEDICGHATLASAYVLFNFLDYKSATVEFESKSGVLSVSKNQDMLVMSLPALIPTPCEIPDNIKQAFAVTPKQCLKSEDYMLVFDNEADIHAAEPDFELLKNIDLRGVMITAKASDYDFIVRFFTPKFGIPEDSVTGSAYAQLAPYWSTQMGQNTFHAKQVSARGGELRCEYAGDRVLISGQAVQYMQGEIDIDLPI